MPSLSLVQCPSSPTPAVTRWSPWSCYETSREFFWPPGQHLFLTGLYALFGTSVIAPRIGTIVLNVLRVVVTVLLARRVLNDERSVRLAGWVAALYPPSIRMSGQPSLSGDAIT